MLDVFIHRGTNPIAILTMDMTCPGFDGSRELTLGVSECLLEAPADAQFACSYVPVPDSEPRGLDRLSVERRVALVVIGDGLGRTSGDIDSGSAIADETTRFIVERRHAAD